MKPLIALRTYSRGVKEPVVMELELLIMFIDGPWLEIKMLAMNVTSARLGQNSLFLPMSTTP